MCRIKRFLSFLLVAALSGVALIVAVKVVPGEFGAFSRAVVGLLLALIIACAISLRLLRTRWREAVANTWLVVMSSFSAYIVCDLVLGSLLLRDYSNPGIPDSVVHHRYAPNSTSLMVKPDYEVTFTTNNLGLRGNDLDPQKPAGVCRILVMGDSFTFGAGVRDGQTFAVLLENALNKDRAFNVQVLNTGVDSYSPILEYLFLKTYGVHWKPDFVVLAFDMSDLTQEQYYRSQALFGKDGTPLAVDGMPDYRSRRPPSKVLQWIASHMLGGSWVVRYVYGQQRKTQTLEDMVERANFDVLRHTIESDAEKHRKEWHDVFESIRLTFRLAREIESGFVLVTYPWGHQVGGSEWSVGRKQFLPEVFKVSDRSLEELRSFAAREGIPFLDLFPPFREYAGGKKLFYDVDMHWTPAGHELVADRLTQFLRAGRLKAWCHAT